MAEDAAFSRRVSYGSHDVMRRFHSELNGLGLLPAPLVSHSDNHIRGMREMPYPRLAMGKALQYLLSPDAA